MRKNPLAECARHVYGRGWGGWALAQGAEDVGFSPGHCPGCKQGSLQPTQTPHWHLWGKQDKQLLKPKPEHVGVKIGVEPRVFIYLTSCYLYSSIPINIHNINANWFLFSMLLIVLAKFTDKIFPSFTNNYLRLCKEYSPTHVIFNFLAFETFSRRLLLKTKHLFPEI